MTAITAIASSVVSGLTTYLTTRTQKSRDRFEEEKLRRRRELQEAVILFMTSLRDAVQQSLDRHSFAKGEDSEQWKVERQVHDVFLERLVRVEVLGSDTIATAARELFDNGRAKNLGAPEWAEENSKLWKEFLALVRFELSSDL